MLLYTTTRVALAGPRPAPSKQDARAVATLREAWIEDLEQKRLDQAIDLYTEDAVFFNPDGPRTDGKAAIRALFDMVMKGYDADIQLRSTGLAVSGDLAYDSGDYDETLTVRATHAKNILHGNYLMVLERGRDHQWRIVQHMWTQSAPAK